ncbi:hypothetical protein [Microbacterium sp. Root180]|uniref:hypothetical protein n=1 Tax=Microbacterium sp. Root180 TaxID=1736483 RepID=UPI0006F6EBDC|nr:hypothetical protein [Microbacterium sp. Root180]KRB37873.1 hypothetical protein ASD93_05975 [Microbacterium sp. Root180]
MTLLSTSTTTLVHHVRLRHAALLRPLGAARGALAPDTWGWRARVSGADTIVTSRTGAGPAPAHVDIVLAGGPYSAALTLPAPVSGQLAGSVRVALTAPEIEVDLAPVPMALIVELVDQGTGAPRTGRTVRVVPQAGPAVPLAETAVAGMYRSADRVWSAGETSADLVVGATQIRKVTVDFTRVQTRIRVADPT